MVTSFFPGNAYKKDLPSVSIFSPKVTTPGTNGVHERSASAKSKSQKEQDAALAVYRASRPST